MQKAFDQIERLLVCPLMHNGGAPKRVTHTYEKFFEELEVMNAVGDGVGAPYKKATSIPQGCPLSRVIMAYKHTKSTDTFNKST